MKQVPSSTLFLSWSILEVFHTSLEGIAVDCGRKQKWLAGTNYGFLVSSFSSLQSMIDWAQLNNASLLMSDMHIHNYQLLQLFNR